MSNDNNTQVIFSDDTFEVRAILHNQYDWRRRTKTRVYVDGEDEVDFSEAYALQRENGFQPKGTDPVEDKLFARLNREVVKNKKAVIEELLQTSEEADEVLTHGGKLTFSRTAGCSCGCSPAFVPATMMVVNGRTIESLFITRKAA